MDERKKIAQKMYQAGGEFFSVNEIAKALNVSNSSVYRWISDNRWERCQEIKEVEEHGVQNSSRHRLTDKQELFCRYYILNFNATKAYQMAYGSSYESSMTMGSRLLRNVKVKNRIIELKTELYNQIDLSLEDILRRHIEIAFSDIGDYITIDLDENNVYHLRLNDLNECDTSLIKEIKCDGDRISLKLQDQSQSLRLLGDYLGLLNPEKEIKLRMLRKQLNEEDDSQEYGVVLIPERTEGKEDEMILITTNNDHET